MIPVDIAEVKEALGLAQNLHKIGFRIAFNASPSYKGLGEDIRKLTINLELLLEVIQRAQYEVGTQNRTTQKTLANTGLLGGFTETLNDCDRLLNDDRYFGKSSGLVCIVNHCHQVDPELQKLRTRLACHNVKLSVVFSILHPQVLEHRAFHIVDATAQILNVTELLGRTIHGGEDTTAPESLYAPPLAIPKELEDTFTRFARHEYPDSFSVGQGVDAAILYSDRICRASDLDTQPEVLYYVAVIDILMAIWMLRTVKDTREYAEAARYPSTTAFERQIDYWGLTIERFFSYLEEILGNAMRRLLGRHQILPPTPDLLAIFEKKRPLGSTPLMTTPEPASIQLVLPIQQIVRDSQIPVELADTSHANREDGMVSGGTKEMEAILQCPDPGYTQTVQVCRQNDKRCSLVLLRTPITEGREKETTDPYDLDHVQIIPSYALRTWTTPSVQPQSIAFRADPNSPFIRALDFQQTKDMFEYQQTVTGYRVVHDDVRILATSQESRFLGGANRQDLCRLQLWSFASAKDSSPSTPTGSARSSSIFTSIEKKRRSQTSSSSSSSFALNKRKSTTPSLFSSRSSSSSRTSVVIDPPSFSNPNLPKGAVFSAPIPPSIVLFAHRAPTLAAKVEGKDISRSFLVVDITPDTTLERELPEHEESQFNATYRCVLEHKGSYLQARRSLETTDARHWDLASVGVHKRQKETEVVKKLKHVILEFDSENKLESFMTKYNQVQTVAKIKMGKFLQATGGSR